jgi:hypothetical protein
VEPDDETAYRENVFTQYVLEFLEETGVVTNSQTVFLETRISRGIGRINGYAVSDEENSIDLFATLYQDADAPVTVGRAEIRQAGDQAARFLEVASMVLLAASKLLPSRQPWLLESPPSVAT